MKNEVVKTGNNQVAHRPQDMMAAIKDLFTNESVKNKFKDLLGKRSTSFITSVLQIVASNDLLKKADPHSIYNAAATAATLDLPLNNNLGFAYIVPYGEKAQFQLGYRGFIQLAQRSGQFKTISACEVYEGQLIEENPLEGFKFDFTKKSSEKIIGYAAYFKLINGFEKTLYMPLAEMEKHGRKYSQTYKKNFGLWTTDFHSMATKTVIKLLLSKYAPLSVEMQKAVTTDQSVINDIDAVDVTYVDNENPALLTKGKDEHETERIKLLIEDATSIEQLEKLQQHITTEELSNAYSARYSDIEELAAQKSERVTA